jgi:lysophospholipase L1-like esterase
LNKIICIGDSITMGKVWKDDERRPYITDKSYPFILKNLLNTEVLNGGVCDITSEQMLRNLSCGMMFEKDSVVLVEIGGNDCNLNWREIKRNPEGSHSPIIPLENFKENLVKLLSIIKGYGAVPVLCTLPPLDGEKYYNLLKRVFGEGIKGWIDRNGGIYKWQENYSCAVKEMAQKTNTYIVDVRKAFLDSMDYRKFISFDGIHPNEEGYLLIANACFAALKSIFGY